MIPPAYVQVPPTEEGTEEEENKVTMVWGDDDVSQEDKNEWESIQVDQSPEASRCVCVCVCVCASVR